MIIEKVAPLEQLLADAAAAVARTLAPGEDLDRTEVMSAQEAQRDLPLYQAVLAPLGGSLEGDVAIFVDEALSEAMRNSVVGELDLADALGSVFDDIGRSLGSVVGVPQAMDARLALSRIGAHPHSGLTALLAGGEFRTAVGAGTALPPEPETVSQAAPRAPSFERLDLLRGVEMAATVELGRTRMTINDLLSLHDGAIIELDRAAGDAADLFVNGRLIARGEVVVVDENYALRITHIVSGEGA